MGMGLNIEAIYYQSKQMPEPRSDEKVAEVILIQTNKLASHQPHLCKVSKEGIVISLLGDFRTIALHFDMYIFIFYKTLYFN